jgi:hypothetical protein
MIAVEIRIASPPAWVSGIDLPFITGNGGMALGGRSDSHSGPTSTSQ